MQVKTNSDLSDMMSKSATNALATDGLDKLKYQLEKEHSYPLYTWLLARLPPAPKHKPPSVWDQAKGALWGGMSKLGGGIAEGVAKGAQALASSRDEAEEAKRNHVY